MANTRKLWVGAGLGALFTGLIVTIIVLLMKQVISFEMALLMFVGLLGLYVGFGVLVMVYRFVGKLE